MLCILHRKKRILLLNGEFRCLLSGIIVDYRRLKTIESHFKLYASSSESADGHFGIDAG